MEGLAVNPGFWSGRRVLITGHTGFKGSWLSAWLEMLGAKLCGYSLAPPTVPNLFTLLNLSERMISVDGDIGDLQRLQKTMQDFQPEIVLHLAAQSLVRYSYSNPVETYATNVLGTVNLLEAVRQTTSISSVIIVTSDKCYRNREWLWGYRENDELGGHDPYSSSKACAEMVASAYRDSFFQKKSGGHTVAIASVRAGNVIGGGDWADDRLVPDLLRAFTNGQQADIRNPDATRPWQHVLEPLSGYLLLAELIGDRPDLAGAWNFGPGSRDVRPVSWIVRRLASLWDGESGWSTDKRNHPHEAYALSLDCSKAHTLLGWSPRLDIDCALEMTVDWFKAYMAEKPVPEITRAQIEQFQEMGAG